MLSSVLSFGIHGIEGFCVKVEADISDGMPMFGQDGVKEQGLYIPG